MALPGIGSRIEAQQIVALGYVWRSKRSDERTVSPADAHGPPPAGFLAGITARHRTPAACSDLRSNHQIRMAAPEKSAHGGRREQVTDQDLLPG
jgi:hypothetical protein